jgi:hypothetical protein
MILIGFNNDDFCIPALLVPSSRYKWQQIAKDEDDDASSILGSGANIVPDATN